MNVTWLGIVVLAILILCVWRGYSRGFIKEIVSFFFVFLSLSLAWAINPYINEFLMQKTPIYNTIQETCANFVQSQGEEKAEYETDSTGDLIDGLKLPDLLRKNLEENNNAETYAALSVDTMTEYVSGYLARTVINGLSYVLAYILSTIMIRLIVYVLNLIAGLPVLKTANKLTRRRSRIPQGNRIYMDRISGTDCVMQHRNRQNSPRIDRKRYLIEYSLSI